jgi:hypothetical protein
MKDIKEMTSDELYLLAAERKRQEDDKKLVPLVKPLEEMNFDGIIQLAMDIMKRIVNDDENEDAPQWCYEEVMETVYGKGIWGIINKIQK